MIMAEIEITAQDEITLMRYDELAVMLGVSTKTARKVVASGAIPLVLIGPRMHRVTVAAAKRFIRSGGTRSDV